MSKSGAGTPKPLKIRINPPTGYPLGVNPTFRICASILIPILKLIARYDFREGAKIPKSGPAIVVSNHVSYMDAFALAFFLYSHGRAPRYLGKSQVFRIPIIGKILLAAEQIPVERESKEARVALQYALRLLELGHLVGVYPEGTLTRDKDCWPMVAKTGAARLAVISKVPVYPAVQWGTQQVLPPYSKKFRIFPRVTVRYRVGEPVDLSRWYGKEEDPVAMTEATAEIMRAITVILEEIRGQERPAAIFDPHTSDLPRTGNFRKSGKKK
jgi:1-acyl-sn-glycerol-3-phosphate acyltransferase